MASIWHLKIDTKLKLAATLDSASLQVGPFPGGDSNMQTLPAQKQSQSAPEYAANSQHYESHKSRIRQSTSQIPAQILYPKMV
jgi:hypothetical protein